uniref:Reverse transcriptase domain-containing protein n=1 Tax=Tanacetum cinerariifolium TaxID=118510 RepID=A0A6L2KIX5_TANCI|nr:reverse transcriptase domain-containing protein [Tanacetum cinerariifolium]
MKVMQAYYATNELPIPPPPAPIALLTVLPSSQVLSPQFDSQDFFLPKEIFPPQKRARFLSHSSADLAAPPHIFKTGESSHKTPLEWHEEHIKTILNHLDELPLEHIEEMEDKIRGLGNGRVIIQRDFKRLETELQEACTQIDRLQKKQMEHDDEVVLARVRISTLEIIIENIQCCRSSGNTSATMANTDNTNRNTRPKEAHVARKCSYKEFMSCQPFNFKGTKGAVRLIHWFERTELVFSHSNCIEDCKVKFATGEPSPTTTTITITATMITTNSRIEGKKPSGLMLPPHLRTKGMLENFPCVEDVSYTTQDLAQSSVIIATREKGHYKIQCQKAHNSAQGRANMLRDRNTHQDPNVVTESRPHSYRQGNFDHPSIAQFLKHVIDSQGIHVDPAKIKVVKNWTSPNTPTEKNKKYIWGEDQESAFQLLKQKLCEALILALPEGNKDFVVYCDASLQAQNKEMKEKNVGAENLRGMDKAFEEHLDGTPCIKNQSWLPLFERLTKSAHFIPTRETDSMETLTRFWQSMQSALGTQLDMSTSYHPETDGQSKRTIKTLEDMLRACFIDFGKGWERHLPLVEFSYSNSYHASNKAVPFEALYGRKCRSPVCWAKVGDVQLTGPEIINETTKKIVQI